ncbi:metallophosphoesterase family protein [Athalassotoga sp.]|uniref:metallophosphoesterase family protein n=1 Tax=Athalassotoga sp. TaxID=2022597 RepID=UPI003CFE3F5A
MKILHCSDLHLGRKVSGSIYSQYFKARYEDYFSSFRAIVDFAISKDIDMVIISGDIFDKKDLSPDSLEKAEDIFKILKDANIKVIAIEGNHDRLFDFESSSWLDYLKDKNYMIILRPSIKDGKVFFEPWNGNTGGMVEIDGVKFYGIGYQGINFPEYIESLGQILDAGDRNIVVIHAGVSDQQTLIMPGFVELKDFSPFDGKCLYIASGHAHQKHIYALEKSKIFIPGAPEYWDLSESGEKGFFIYDTEDGSVDFFESKRRLKIEKTIKLETGNADEFKHAFSKMIEENPVETNCIYMVNVGIPFGTFLDININEFENEMENMGALKGKITVRQLSDHAKHDDKDYIDLYDIENSIVSKDEKFGKHSGSVVEVIDALKKISLQEDAFKIIDDLFDKITE